MGTFHSNTVATCMLLTLIHKANVSFKVWLFKSINREFSVESQAMIDAWYSSYLRMLTQLAINMGDEKSLI